MSFTGRRAIAVLTCCLLLGLTACTRSEELFPAPVAPAPAAASQSGPTPTPSDAGVRREIEHPRTFS
ncbi:hypothetical protein [Nocardioides sp.]|uniref:hypothetical protein n=1 Tax=Nocardioides sp. TaxID=35761 RepID=UPI0035634D8B